MPTDLSSFISFIWGSSGYQCKAGIVSTKANPLEYLLLNSLYSGQKRAMRGLIQRVSQASVSVDGVVTGDIQQGILLLLGVQKGDSTEHADKLLQKVLNYRIFGDEEQKMNLSLKDIQGDLLVVSQFTLAADTRKGLRPGFSTAASPELARELFQYFVDKAKQESVQTHMNLQTGIFAADMQVTLVNDGPVTFLLEC